MQILSGGRKAVGGPGHGPIKEGSLGPGSLEGRKVQSLEEGG